MRVCLERLKLVVERVDDRPGERAGRGGLLTVGDRRGDRHPLAASGAQRTGDVVGDLGLDADDPRAGT
jgi:hypothetical protein